MHSTSESTVAQTRADRSGSAAARRRRAIPTLTILAHPDAGRVGERAVLGELVTGHGVRLARLQPEFCAPGERVGRPLRDRHLSRRPIELRRLEPASWSFDASDSSTTLRVDSRLVSNVETLGDGDLERGVVLELADRVALLFHWHTPSSEADLETFGLVGYSDSLVEVRREIRRVADLRVAVLIRGETGTGKELVARALHSQSPRGGPFVDVNLGALPPTLAASELFGTVRGAYTGSTRSQDGCFVRAGGGTLFLDEIGEAPPEIQVSLLRVLETGEVHALGAESPRRVDVRTVAATDADLASKIADGSFREPLLHRLAGYEICLAPLRERREDIGRLLVSFLREYERELGDRRLDAGTPWIETELVSRLARFPWPGNVRQLRNVVHQLAIGNRGRQCLRATEATDRILRQEVAPDAPRPSPSPAAARRALSEIDDAEVLEALRGRRFEIKAAAEVLGISRAALYNWIEASPKARTAGQLDEELVRAAHRQLGGDLDALVERLEVSRFALRRRLRELGL